MMDVLLRFPSREAAIQVGAALGYTVQDPETGEWVTTQATLTLAVCVIGEHPIPTGETTTGPNGEPVPVYTGDGNWWVMVRSLEDLEIPEAILPFIVQPNPADSTIPNRVWA